ncbi:hypothetical protein BDR22DRAFT_819312 [Usnea florida]
MAPFSSRIANASHSNATFGSPPRPTPTPCQPIQPALQNQWGPDSISNIVFGPIMVFLSLFAIYQSRKQSSQRSAAKDDVRSGEVNVEDEVAESDLSIIEIGCERRTLEFAGRDEEDSGGFLPREGDLRRTDTDLTLIDGNEESRTSALKA